jgi:hypothetical protein
MEIRHRIDLGLCVLLFTLLATAVGCGTTKTQKATEQLLLSDAVDKSVASLDFQVLAGQAVYLDTQFLSSLKTNSLVGTHYLESSLRQQLLAAGCLLQESENDAAYIVEPRVGALGTDGHNLTVGIPASHALNSASSLVTEGPSLPIFPEIALVRRENQKAAAKLAVFAYHRETRKPIWQSGIAQSQATSTNTWVMGAGPFQRGTIHDGTQFAGSRFWDPLALRRFTAYNSSENPDTTIYFREVQFSSDDQQDGEPVQAAIFDEEPATTPLQPDGKPLVRPTAANASPKSPAPTAADTPPDTSPQTE